MCHENQNIFNNLQNSYRQQASKFEDMLGVAFSLELTSDYPGLGNIEKVDSKIFIPSVIKMTIKFIFVAGFLALILSLLLRQTSYIQILIAVGFIGAIVYFFAKNKRDIQKRNRMIRIDNIGIKIDSTQFKWKEITLTCILRRPLGKNEKKYLILVTGDNSGTLEYELTDYFSFNPYGFAATLSTYIESLRPTK